MSQQPRSKTTLHLSSLSLPLPARKSSLPLGATSLGVAALGIAALLSGCAGSLPANFGAGNPSSPKGATAKISGKVYGGQQPISGASIQLYTVGTTGLKSASTGLLTAPLTSGADGTFSLTGLYSCTNATDVYLVATGGNPGGGSANSAISLVAALGPCATLLANAATTFIQVNEVTTIAAAYALAPFAADYAHIGAPSPLRAGLPVAFVNAALLANTTTGTAGGANLATGVTVPVAELNTLGNILASCINTNGPGSGGCSALSTATGAAGPTGTFDTFDAAIAIARNPGAAAVTALYTQSNPQAPFQPSLALSSAPNDFTVAVTMAGSAGTLATPYGVAIDASGNAWVANESGTTVAAFSPSGGFTTATAAGLFGARASAIDKNGNVWVANTAGNSVIELAPTAGFVPGVTGSVSLAGSFTAGGIDAPSAIAIDSQNHVFAANFNGNSVTELSNNGAALNSSPFTGSSNDIASPSGIALDTTGDVYVTSGLGYAVKLSNTGVYAATITDNALQGPAGIALDPANDVVLTGFTTGTSISGAVSEFNSSGVSALANPLAQAGATPSGVASDGTSFWVANSTSSGSLGQLTYGTASPVSPTAGFGSLNTPIGVAIDPSGSIWTANSGSNTISKFIGLAAPVTTPLAANVGP
jgi:hypothetical protein